MVIGDKSNFGIEFELNKDYGGVWLFGKFCYWINGKRIGDYELGTSLRDVLFLLEQLIRDNGNRFNETLFSLEPTELFNRLNGALYTGDSQYERVANEELWARFDVGLPIDIFNEWKIFMVESLEKSRFIYRNINSTENRFINEVIINAGDFDNIVIKTYVLLDELYKKENLQV